MPTWEPLSDDTRFPAIPPERRGLLARLREHPHAPRWNLACGDRLTPGYLESVRRWAAALRAGPVPCGDGATPPWLERFTARALAQVPFYRERIPAGTPFAAVPSLRRADLVRAPWDLVPDDQPLDDILVYPTSGSTGPAFPVYSHPITANAYLAFLEVALARVGVAFEPEPAGVALACVHCQRDTYTYPSLMSYLEGAGFVKVNLLPSEWRDPADAAAFLDACASQVYTGDPYAFACLARLPLRSRPRALISSATALLPGLRAELEAHFGCPVLDLYSLTEARTIAVSYGEGHEVLAHDVLVEVLDPLEDRLMPLGERGEVAVSGGCNPFLPLLRYRTGDFARLECRDGRTVLRDLEARPPVCLLDESGTIVNSIDVSRALAGFALPRFQLHQHTDGALTLRVDDTGREDILRDALLPLFGPGRPLAIRPVDPAPDPGRKLLQYTSDLPPPPGYETLFGGGP